MLLYVNKTSIVIHFIDVDAQYNFIIRLFETILLPYLKKLDPILNFWIIYRIVLLKVNIFIWISIFLVAGQRDANTLHKKEMKFLYLSDCKC